MSTRFEEFLSEVLPYVHDCPEFVATNAIRNAAIEFSDKTLYWLFELDPISLVAGTNAYDLELPFGTASARVMDVWYNTMPLTQKSTDELRVIFGTDWRVQQGTPEYITLLDPSTVLVAPVPELTENDALNMVIALRPTRDSTDIDDIMYERWAEHIAFGARARLYGTPGQPYYDPQNSAAYRTLFESAIGEAKLERSRGLGRTTLRVRPPLLV